VPRPVFDELVPPPVSNIPSLAVLGGRLIVTSSDVGRVDGSFDHRMFLLRYRMM
jgi:hypothetical protein